MRSKFKWFKYKSPSHKLVTHQTFEKMRWRSHTPVLFKNVCIFYNCYKNVLKSPLLYRDIPVTTAARPPPCVYFAMNTLPGNRGVMFGGFTILMKGIICIVLLTFTYFSNLTIHKCVVTCLVLTLPNLGCNLKCFYQIWLTKKLE